MIVTDSRRIVALVTFLVSAASLWVYLAIQPYAAAAQGGPADLPPVDVALDPGHSSWDVGTSGGGLREYEVTLDVANRARAWLTMWGYSVRLTREGTERIAPTVPPDPTAAVAT